MASKNALYSAIWQTADDYLRLITTADKYGDFILAFTVLRRIECELEPTKDEVIDYIKQIEKQEVSERVKERRLRFITGKQYYNTSSLDLTKVAQRDNVKDALKEYLYSFSDYLMTVWRGLEFDRLIEDLDENDQLWNVVNHFSQIDLSEKNIEDKSMGELFEDLMNRSFTRKGQDAGEFYTPRDAIFLAMLILFSPEEKTLSNGKNHQRSMYDPTAGTAGMLISAKNYLNDLNPKIELHLAGQELKKSSIALGQADLLMQGVDDINILKQGNTLTDDKFADTYFDYIASNPPYGSSWKSIVSLIHDLQSINDERYAHGLPPVSDGQMLFMMHVISKLKEPTENSRGGRGFVVTNGSPLFTGDPCSGPDSIRQYILDNDYLDAVVALPQWMFYNTGIATYLWYFDKDKEEKRKGKVQLIDASETCSTLNKSVGDKKYEFSVDNAFDIKKVYEDFEESERSIIVSNDDLKYKDVPMYFPARYRVDINEETIATAMSHKSSPEGLDEILQDINGVDYNSLEQTLKDEAKERGIKMTKTIINHVIKSVVMDDETAPIALDAKGEIIPNKSTKVVERIGFEENIDEHMERDILPYAEDILWNEDETKVGSEVPVTRFFYKKEDARPLEEIDSDIGSLISDINIEFRKVRSDD